MKARENHKTDPAVRLEGGAATNGRILRAGRAMVMITTNPRVRSNESQDNRGVTGKVWTYHLVEANDETPSARRK